MKSNLTDNLRLTDEQLCELASCADTQAEELLVSRYSRLVRICSRPLFLAGGDSEDLIQEGMFGLLRAIRTYDASRQAQFRTYAEICIRSQLLSAVRRAACDKHSPLNNYISFETPLFDAAGYPSDPMDDPEQMLIGKEEWKERIHALKDQLSGFETEILQLYLSGFSYAEIAQRTGKTPKSVDNAVQRIRRKVARQLNSGDISNADRKY